MLIIAYRKIFYWIAATTVGLSIVALLFFGLNFGVDFTGGTLAEARYTGATPTSQELAAAFNERGFSAYSLRTADADGYILRAGDITDAERAALTDAFSVGGAYTVSIERFTEVGPTIGKELRNKALIAIALVIFCIILYIAFTFRKVSADFEKGKKGVSSWVYGVLAVFALVHDIIIPTGLIAALGFFFGSHVDTLFIMALLAILGYSVNDTIVVFDRVREILHRNHEENHHEDFELTVGKSVNQTFTRSVNTSLTTLFVLITLFFLGPEATQDFALVLAVGIIAGTYSSLCLATPLLVTVERWRASR